MIDFTLEFLFIQDPNYGDSGFDPEELIATAFSNAFCAHSLPRSGDRIDPATVGLLVRGYVPLPPVVEAIEYPLTRRGETPTKLPLVTVRAPVNYISRAMISAFTEEGYQFSSRMLFEECPPK